MAQDWIVEVLQDLRQYAIRNYLLRLAEELDDAIVVATAELRAVEMSDDEGPAVHRPAPTAIASNRALASLD